MDDPATLAKFATSLGAPFPFLSDASGVVGLAYGVRKATDPYDDRATFVLAPDGTIRAISRGMAALDPTNALAAAKLIKPR